MFAVVSWELVARACKGRWDVTALGWAVAGRAVGRPPSHGTLKMEGLPFLHGLARCPPPCPPVSQKRMTVIKGVLEQSPGGLCSSQAGCASLWGLHFHAFSQRSLVQVTFLGPRAMGELSLQCTWLWYSSLLGKPSVCLSVCADSPASRSSPSLGSCRQSRDLVGWPVFLFLSN